MPEHTHVLYRFFNKYGSLLYVGITKNPENRFASHRQQKPWWDKVTTITLERFADRRELARAEIAAIESEKPRYNLAYSVGSPVQAMRVSNPVYDNDANRFGTTYDGRAMLPLRISHPLPCDQCQMATVYRNTDEYGKPVDDVLRCFNCERGGIYSPNSGPQA